MNDWLPLQRFLDTLRLVAHEAKHLAYSRERVFGEHIDTDWVKGLAVRSGSYREGAPSLPVFLLRAGLTGIVRTLGQA